jgi:hypothetical protein
MKILRVRRFVEQWNEAIDKDRNPTLAAKNTGIGFNGEGDDIMGAR